MNIFHFLVELMTSSLMTSLHHPYYDCIQLGECNNYPLIYDYFLGIIEMTSWLIALTVCS